MRLSDFANVCKRLGAEGLSDSMITHLRDLGAKTKSGHAIDENTTDFSLIDGGYHFHRNGESWSISND